MARLTLILGVLATVVYLLDGFRFMLNEWRNWRNKVKKDGTWLSLLACLMLVPATAFAGVVETEKATDNFNTGGPGLSANWTTVSGLNNPQIVSQLVQPEIVGGNGSAALYTGRAWTADQYSEISLTTLATSSGRVAVAVVRGVTGTRTEYECHAAGPLGATVNLSIIKYVAGASTLLETTGANQTVASTDILKCLAYENRISLYINDVLKLTDTDSAVTSGSPGLIAFTSAGSVTDTQIDNWAGGEVTTMIETFPAASCSYTDVNAAVVLATHGDTVTIPACAQTNWTTQLSITQGITIVGAGEGVTILGDNVTKNGSATSSFMSIDVNAPYTFDVSGFTLVGVATDPSVWNKGHFAFGGTTKAFRMHNITINPAQTSGIRIYGSEMYGLVDHVTFTGANQQFGVVWHSGWGGSNWGDGSWLEPQYLGTNKSIYFEDNTITQTGGSSLGIIDCFQGGRYVSRYNTTIDHSFASSHGADSGNRYRGCRSIEAYENNVTYTRAFDRGSQVRGGSGVIYNNHITSGFSVTSMAVLQNYRSEQFHPPWGMCKERPITGITRSGTTATATTASAHSYSNNAYARVSGANQSEYNGIYQVSNVTGTTFDYTVTGSPATPATGTLLLTGAWDGNQVGEGGYRCVDQPGSGISIDLGGTGNQLGTTPPTPAQDIGNALDPVYVWGNTLNGASDNSVSTGFSTQVQVNRDYYNDGTTRPGYTAYTYPHPLQGGGATAAPSPVVIARVIRWMEVAAFVTGMGWHFRKPIMAVSLAVLSWTVTVGQFTPRAYDTVKSVSRESAVKALTVFNHLTKPRD